MTYQRREEIYSKDVLNIQDIMDLMDIPYSTAAEMMDVFFRRNRFTGKYRRLKVKKKRTICLWRD